MQSLDRETVAAALRTAEDLRDSYRVRFEAKYVVGERNPEGQRAFYDRMSDGQGRVRRTISSPVSDSFGDTSLEVWSATGNMALKYSSTNTSAPELLSITAHPIITEHLDEIEFSLGLRFMSSPRRPSDVVSDKGENVMVRLAPGDTGLVEVVFVAPSFHPHLVITNIYDPGRQWALVEERFVGAMDDVVGEVVAPDRRFISTRYEMTDWKQSNGVWVPTRVHDHTTLRPDSPQQESYDCVTEFQTIDIGPPISATDFELPVGRLPKGSTIADATLGVSYKLGQDLLYMDGRLHKLTQPVTGVISAEDLPTIMQNAVALIPDTPPLQPVASATSWWRVGGYSFLAGGVVVLGAVFWIRRHGAAS